MLSNSPGDSLNSEAVIRGSARPGGSVAGMRLGCPGCLGTVLLVALVALAAGWALGAGQRMLATPAGPPLPVTTAADGSRAQQKLFEGARRSQLTQPVIITEAEVNALLARHLVQARGVRLNNLGIRLIGGDRVELIGQVALGQLLDEAGLAALGGLLPRAWRERPVWIHVGARTRVEAGERRQLQLDVEDFAVGRQRLPARMLRLMLDPASVGLLRWALPSHVDSVAIEPGRVVIRGAAARSRSEAEARRAARRAPATPPASAGPRSSRAA
jgi:hypothetical protein